MATLQIFETVEKVGASCTRLKEAKYKLWEAEKSVKNDVTKMIIKDQIYKLQDCIIECENIVNTLPSRQRQNETKYNIKE